MNERKLRELNPGSADWDRALAWATVQFERALLFLGDASHPLVRHARFWSWVRAGRVHGVAVRFEGFAEPSVSVAATDLVACSALIDAAAASGTAMLVTEADQPLPAAIARKPAVYDPWLHAPCLPSARDPSVCAIADAAELGAFYAREGVHYWHPDMLRSGHCFGVRADTGTLVCAGGLNFVVGDRSYAHLGGLITAKNARGRSHATAVLNAIRTSLAASGVSRCGLFADASNPRLPAFYAARGFRPLGRFGFRALP